MEYSFFRLGCATLKKVMLLLWMFTIVWMPAAYAASIPAQQGLVVDEAGLLSSGDAAALAKVAAGDRYTFHILTIDSLDGTDSAAYATEAYDAWDLSTRDVLLLISSEEHQVELNFINPGLQASLDTWARSQGGYAGSAAITALLDTYFIPYAGAGDFAGGISSLMKSVHSLGSAQGAGGETTGAGAGSGTAGGSGAAGGGGTEGSAGAGSPASGAGSGGSAGHPPAASGDSSGLPLLVIVLIVIGAALILGVGFIAITGIRHRKKLNAQQELLGDLLVQANRAIESLKPFQGIVQGKTGKMVEGISGRLSNLLIQISALRNENSGAALPLYRLAALKSAAGKLRGTNDSFRTAIEEEEKQIAVISDAERNVKQRINELKSDAPELNEQLLSTIRETGFQLQEIAEDLLELSEETAKADQLELFDPIAAQDLTGQAQEKQEQIERDLKDVDVYDDKINDFPETLASARSQIAGIIEQNSLQNMKVKPYENLEQASREAAALEAPLAIGNMDEVRKIAGRLDILLQEAVAMTERQALLRQNNRRDLETVRSNWSQLKQRRDALEARLRESRARFAEQHVSEAGAALETWSTRLREGAAEVPQIEGWTSDERGDFETARQALDRLLSLQEAAGQQFNGVSASLEELNERLNKVSRLFSGGVDRVNSAEHSLQSRGLSARGRFELTALPEYGELQRQLASGPYHLDELETAARSYEARINAFVEEANRLIRQKEEEERQAQLARMREQQRREQARKRMSSGPPSSGGGFGGGRSSGGSSWGGSSGRSSGGSSWGGGKSGRNSSGGSKW